MNDVWVRWAQELQAIAQNGLHYATNDYDRERYESIARIAAEIHAIRMGLPASALLPVFRGELGHATPKVDVRGVVFDGDALLLVREREDGGWTLPGGWADVGDTPASAVEREIREESGYRTRAQKLLAVLDRNRQGHPPHPFHIYKILIQCEMLGGEATPSNETSEVGFFREHEIPELSLARVLPRQITRLFQHRLHPEWPADFD
jgi:ADP-ribose pyrophosphatase YjhB (NUDIX family)